MAQITLNSSGVASNGTLALQSNGTTTAVTIDASQNVGIGTTSPLSKLHVNADTGTAVNIITMQTGLDNPSGNKSIVWRDGTNTFGRISVSYAAPSAKMTFGSLYNSGYQTSDLMTLEASGNLLVGTTSAFSGGIAGVHVNSSSNAGMAMGISGTIKGWIYASGPTSNVRLESVSGYNVACISATNGVYLSNGSTSWSALSDERHKEIIEPIENATAKVSTLRAVIGKYKTDAEGTRRSFLIAQDVQAVLPEAVNVQNDEIGTLGVQYTDTIPLLVAAIKEQQAIIESLKARLDAANL